MDIVEFLRERLSEDERTARAATPGPWSRTGEQCYAGEDCGDDHKHGWGHSGPDLDGPGEEAPVLYSWGHDADQITVTRADAEHIARHDPARALADVAAKRAIIRRVHHAIEYGSRGANVEGFDPLETYYVECSCGWKQELMAVKDWDMYADPHLVAVGFDEDLRDSVLSSLCAPFADHPDFDPAWKVDP